MNSDKKEEQRKLLADKWVSIAELRNIVEIGDYLRLVRINPSDKPVRIYHVSDYGIGFEGHTIYQWSQSNPSVQLVIKEEPRSQQIEWDLEPLISKEENQIEFGFPPTAVFDEKYLPIEKWEIEFMETECGWPCTPQGCCGHPTKVPENLYIGGITLKFDTEVFSTNEEYDAAIKVGKFLSDLIEEHKTKNQETA